MFLYLQVINGPLRDYFVLQELVSCLNVIGKANEIGMRQVPRKEFLFSPNFVIRRSLEY